MKQSLYDRAENSLKCDTKYPSGHLASSKKPWWSHLIPNVVDLNPQWDNYSTEDSQNSMAARDWAEIGSDKRIFGR